MKNRFLIILLIIPIAVSCSGGTLFSKPTVTPTPTSVPTKTPQPTPTLLPTETPQPVYARWDLLLPDDIQFCKSTNTFSEFDPEKPELLVEEINELLEHERSALSADSTPPFFTIDFRELTNIIGDNPGTSHRPSVLAYVQWTPIFLSCSYLPFADGSGMYVMGMLTERKESDHISILHFGVDDTGFKQLYEDGGFNPDNYDLEVHYPMIGEGTVDKALFALITGAGYTHPDGPWQRSLDLLVKQRVVGGPNLRYLLLRYFDSKSTLTENEVIEMQEILEQFIIPCFGLSIHT